MQSYSHASPSYIEPRPHAYPLKLGALALLLVATAAAAALGSIASINAQDFYLALNRPEWAPPPGVFGPVWSVLYLLMAIAAWIVVRVDAWPVAKPKMIIYGTQLVLNAIWSWTFFRWHSGAAAFVDVIALWLMIATTIAVFSRAHKLAGILLIPYIAWVSFATALTWTVWQLNPGAL